MSNFSMANLADTLRISVFGGDVTVYFFVFRSLDCAALVKDGNVIAWRGLRSRRKRLVPYRDTMGRYSSIGSVPPLCDLRALQAYSAKQAHIPRSSSCS